MVLIQRQKKKMGMAISASSRRERAVLKLVHPGRYVEIHRKPIAAAEIMKRNPRHCIARPDVFKFPWFVVRPESILTPGKVFYIVPNRTIHRLLKDRGLLNRPSSQQERSPKKHDRLTLSKQHVLPPKSWAGMTPEHQMHGQSLHNRFQFMSSDDASSSSEQLRTTDSQLKSWENSNENNRRHESCSYYSDFSTDASNGSSFSSALGKTVWGDDLQTMSYEQQTSKLKSCLRKPGSARKPQNFKVTFTLLDAATRSPRDSLSLNSVSQHAGLLTVAEPCL